MPEVKYNQNHHSGATEAQRLAHRLRDSGDAQHADTTVHHGSSPLRHISHVHHSYNKRYGEGDAGAPGIDGQMRGVVDQGDGR